MLSARAVPLAGVCGTPRPGIAGIHGPRRGSGSARAPGCGFPQSQAARTAYRSSAGAIFMNGTIANGLGILLAASIGVAGEAPRAVAAQAATPAPSDDEKAIRAMLGSFVEAFGKGEARTIAGLYTEGGEAVDADG